MSVGIVVERTVTVVRNISDGTTRVDTVNRYHAAVRVVIVVQHISRDKGTAFVRGKTDPRIVRGDRWVIQPGDRDRHRGGICPAIPVADRIAKSIYRGLAWRQGIELPVGIVAEGAVTVVRDVTHRAARIDTSDGKCPAINVVIVIKNISCRERRIFSRSVLSTTVVIRRRLVVDTVDRNENHCRIRPGKPISDRIFETVRRGLTDPQCFIKPVGVVVEGAVTVAGHISNGTACIEALHGQGNTVDVGVVIENIAACEW